METTSGLPRINVIVCQVFSVTPFVQKNSNLLASVMVSPPLTPLFVQGIEHTSAVTFVLVTLDLPAIIVKYNILPKSFMTCTFHCVSGDVSPEDDKVCDFIIGN
jgi:hypothetical protein